MAGRRDRPVRVGEPGGGPGGGGEGGGGDARETYCTLTRRRATNCWRGK